MSPSLTSILRQFSGATGTLGGGLDHAALRRALDAAMQHLRWLLWLAAGMTLVIFCVEIGVALMHIAEPGVLAGISGAMGLTCAGSIETVRRIARQMAETNLLMALASELDAQSLRPIIAALARRL